MSKKNKEESAPFKVEQSIAVEGKVETVEVKGKVFLTLPTDVCLCSHMRRDHKGKCTMHVYGMGTCDCVEFRRVE